MRSLKRSHLLIVILVMGAAFLLVTMSPFVQHEPAEPEEQADVMIVAPVENGSAMLWPYTSRGPTFRQATLPINVVVHADAATVHRLLTTRSTSSRLHWNASSEQWTTHGPGEGNVSINGTGIHWDQSAGSERYTYIQTENGGVWKTSTYQIHDGTYFGSRHHLRLYEGGDGAQTWTAIQAHHEYWDWFRLRHDVNSLSRSRQHVEHDLIGSGLTASVSRERWGNGGALDADGWVTVFHLTYRVTSGPEGPDEGASPGRHAMIASLLWLTLTPRREALHAAVQNQFERLRQGGIDHHAVALFAVTALLPLTVRIGAIAAEQTFREASPVVIGGPFYFLLVLGLPISAYLLGRHVPAQDGFDLAILGGGTGMMVDYAYLGLVAIPYGALVQRLVLLFGLGLIAADGTRWSAQSVARHRFHTVGAAIWVLALVWPLV